MSDPGYTSSSSANGASVASIRAPRTTIESEVSETLWSATWPIACSASGFVRSTCGFISAWVVDRSASRMYSWYATRLAARAELPRRPQTSDRPAKHANVTFR